MHKLFWMAFVAAFPTFPHGDWLLWDLLITIEGNFISSWVLGVSGEQNSADDSPSTYAAIQRSIRAMFFTAVEETLLIPATH